MSIKQDRIGTRTAEDLRQRLNVGEIAETGKKVDASVETVQKLSNQVSNLSNQVTGLNNSVTNTRESYVSTNAQTFTDEQKTRARDNIGAGNSSFSGSYNDLSNKPTIPTKTSQLENDAGYVTDVGTIVPIDVKNEKSTSTTDPYSCYYVNKLNTYSTEETFTGQYWIDGKAIYRKVIFVSEIDCSTAGFHYIEHNISNFGIPININYILNTENIPNTHNSIITALAAVADSNGTRRYIRFYCGAWEKVSNWYFIIEYTKTTD